MLYISNFNVVQSLSFCFIYIYIYLLCVLDCKDICEHKKETVFVHAVLHQLTDRLSNIQYSKETQAKVLTERVKGILLLYFIDFLNEENINEEGLQSSGIRGQGLMETVEKAITRKTDRSKELLCNAFSWFLCQ